MIDSTEILCLEGLSGAQVQDARAQTDIQTVLILTLYALI